MALMRNDIFRCAFRKRGPSRSAVGKTEISSTSHRSQVLAPSIRTWLPVVPTRRPGLFSGMVPLGGGLDTVLHFAVLPTNLFKDPIS
jgi:hypothetical protein